MITPSQRIKAGRFRKARLVRSHQAAVFAGALVLVSACGAPQRHIVLGPVPQSVDGLLAANPADPSRNITAVPLGQSERSSRHLVYIRDREPPHLHATHDLTLTLLRGKGTMWIEDEPIALKAGDVAIIGAGTPHYFVNDGAEPAAAFVVFSPPSDGSDRVLLVTP